MQKARPFAEFNEWLNSSLVTLGDHAKELQSIRTSVYWVVKLSTTPEEMVQAQFQQQRLKELDLKYRKLAFIIVRVATRLFIQALSSSLRRESVIRKGPGTRWLAFVEFFYSPKTVELTFKPLIAEWQHEIFEALKEGRTRKVYWISMRHRWYFLKAMGLSELLEAIEKVVGLVKKG
jgi:hypothetical protein